MMWMEEIYKDITLPMTLNIKELMKDFCILNEAELFCSEMQYKVNDGGITDRIIGDGSR